MSDRVGVLETLLASVENESLRTWERKLAARLSNVNTRIAMVGRVVRFLRFSGGVVDEPSLERFFVELGRQDASVDAKKGYQRCLRLFWEHVHADQPIPPILKVRLNGGKNQITRADLLTDNEIATLIEMADNPRDKAIVALLYDLGCRIDELASLRWEDVREHPDYPKAFMVTIRRSKTMLRTVTVFEAFPYLRDYLNVHPLKARGPLWVGKKAGKLVGMDTSGLRWVILRLVQDAKDAGRIDKDRHIYAHLFRHTRATRLLELGYSEARLKQRLGWTLSSKMLVRYVHLAQEADADEEARVHGIKVAERKRDTGLKHVLCSECESPNPPTNVYCSVCGGALNKEEAIKRVLKEAAKGLAETRKLFPRIRITPEMEEEYIWQNLPPGLSIEEVKEYLRRSRQ